MPKRSRSGVVRSPVRVVAPTSVNGFSSRRSEWAPGPWPIDDVDAAVLHRRIEELLDRPVQAVDLVDEEDVLGLERRQDRGHVGLAVDGRARHDPERRGHLGRDDARERRLAQARRPGQEHVLARLAAPAGGLEEDAELLLDLGLAHELGQAPGPQRAVELLLARRHEGVGDAAHRASRSCRTRERPGQREPDALLDRDVLVDVAKRRLGLGHRHPKPDQGVARSGMVVAARVGRPVGDLDRARPCP